MKASGSIGAVVVLVVALLGACGDDDDGEDLAGSCDLMADIAGPEDVSVEKLDDLLAIAPNEIEDDVRLIRDQVDADGETAFENEEVGVAFERVGSFEADEC
jgi:hypothetical protein